MAQTVIGMFESSSKAQAAVQELVQSGITDDRIDVSTGNSGTAATTTDSDDDNRESGIARFFKSLFGNDDDDADKYTRVASRAQSIVTVHAESSDEAERVADILDDNGAVDVDEHASRLGYDRAGSYSGTTGTGVGNTGGSDYGNSSLATDTTTGLASVGGTTGLADTGTTGYTGTGASGTGTSDYTGTTGTSDYTGNRDTSDYTGTTGTTGTAGTRGYADTTGSDLGNTTNEETRIPIIEEKIEVGKREVSKGGVRLRSRIIERPVEESVRLREERVNIERNTVDRPATEADLQNFEERDIEMVERAEVPVVNKEARVVEEVSISKEVEERNETVQDTVRRTEVDVENYDDDENTRRKSNTTNTDL